MIRRIFRTLARWTVDTAVIESNKSKTTMIDYSFKEDMYGLRMASNLIVNPAKKKAEAKISNCFFCDLAITKVNKNDCHLVPKSFLKKIAVDQKVCVFDTITGLNRADPENYFNSQIDADSAGTFFAACKNCDGPQFAVYEDPKVYELTHDKMRLIAIKTLLAFRYFNLCSAFRSLNCIDLANKEYRKQFSLDYSEEEISDFLMSQKPVIDHVKLYFRGLANADLSHRCADAVNDNLVTFEKIIDVEIPGNPVVALQSYAVIDTITVHVNIFPLDTGSRIIIFRDKHFDSYIDDKLLCSYSVIQLIALATANFRNGIYLSPKVSLAAKQGDSLFALLGPLSKSSLSKKDLNLLSMKSLASAINLEDPRMFIKIDKLKTIVDISGTI